MWRIVGFLINPLAAILWPIVRGIGRGIDRMLGPVAGWYFAIILALIAAGLLASSLYAISGHLGRATGLLAPLEVATTSGIVRAVDVLSEKTTSRKERLMISYTDAGGTHSFTTEVTAYSGGEHAPGDSITVYLPANEDPTIRDPNDQFLAVFFSLVGTIIPGLLVFFAMRYLRYRKRRYDARSPRPIPEYVPVAQGGRDRVLTTAERMRQDELRTRAKTQR